MQVRISIEQIPNLAYGKALVSHDDTTGNLVLGHKGVESAAVQGISGIWTDTKELLKVKVVGIHE